MEALLLVASVCAVVMLAYRVYRSEQAKGDPGLGIFGFREILGKTRPQPPNGKPDA